MRLDKMLSECGIATRKESARAARAGQISVNGTPVRNADAIMVLENGEIIERGDHDDLLAMKGRYYELYTGMFELN